MTTPTPHADETILVVPQFHYDIAYLQTEQQYYPRCWANLRAAIDIMDAHPDYRYTVEQPFLLEQFAAQCPGDFARLCACFGRGQMEVSGALYVIPDMNIPCGEALIRQALLGKRWVKGAFGADVGAAWCVDVWGHPDTLPQILTHCGIGAYFFTRAMRPELAQGDFLWQGSDGTLLPTHWLPDGYASLRFPDTRDIENAAELALTDASAEGLRDLVARLRPRLAQGAVLLCNGGDMAPPQASAPRVVAHWQQQGLPVRFGTVADYAAALAAHAQSLPRVTGDFNPLFIGTQGSRIRLKQHNRALENALLAAESLHAVCRLWGSTVGPLGLDDAWKLLLKNQFHDIISGTLVDAAYQDALTDYAAAFGMVQARVTQLGAGRTGVFNPSGWPRTEWVAAADGQGTAPVVVPALGWAVVPAQAAPLPAPLPCDADPVLENEYWRIVVGPSGTLSSVIDAQTGQEFVPAAGPGWGDLVYRNDNGDLWLLDRGPLGGGSEASKCTEPQSDDPYRGTADPLVNDFPACQHTGAHRRTYAARPGEQQVTVAGRVAFWNNAVDFTTRLTLRANDPLIYFHTTVQCHGRHYRLYVCCPTPWKDARLRHQTPFGAAERDGRRYVAQDWAEARGPDGDGVRLLNSGLPGHAVNDGVLSVLLMRSAAMEYKAESVQGFEDGETLVFDYAVRPFTAANPGNAAREGERLNRPLCVFPPAAGAETPGDRTGFALSPDNAHLSAFYALEDGRYLLRLCETMGRPAQGDLHLAVPTLRAWECNGVEERGAPVTLTDSGALPFMLRPWQIYSWLLEGA